MLLMFLKELLHTPVFPSFQQHIIMQCHCRVAKKDLEKAHETYASSKHQKSAEITVQRVQDYKLKQMFLFLLIRFSQTSPKMLCATAQMARAEH